MSLSTATGAITVTGNAGSFGTTLNALGLGGLPAGVSMFTPPTIPPITGTLYYSPINVNVSGLGGTGLLTAYASVNFTHSAAFVGYICASGCTSSAGFTQLALTSSPQTTIAAAVAATSTTEVWLGVFVAAVNGSGPTGGWGSADSIAIKFAVTDSAPPHKTATQTFTLNLTAERAVGLWLSTGTGGLTVSPAADFTMNFQNVNGLGISPATGLSTTSVSGGYVYHTPYTITPVFSGSSTGTNGTVTVQLKTGFTKPAIIYLEDSGVSGGPYNAITGTAVTVASAAANTAVTRYLGLFVSNANGAGTFTGTDSSSLTYTLTEP